jgi:DNA repair protein RecO (recombination protein O)
LGFGLDLSRCAGTGSKKNLIYVSPRSGRAVSEPAGEPYRDKLLPLPSFLRDAANDASPEELGAALHLTAHFLNQWVLAPHDRPLPKARLRLSDYAGASGSSQQEGESH